MRKFTWLVCALTLAGCGVGIAHPDDEMSPIDGGSIDPGNAGGNGHGNGGGAGTGSGNGDGSTPDLSDGICDGPEVSASGVISATVTDKVDILFMVDNSNSMKEEQDALKAQFPKLIDALTTGFRNPTDPAPFAPARDIHLAVVSSDMGLVGVNGITACTGFGDDGVMRDPSAAMCNGGVSGQRFLSFKGGDVTQASQLASNFGCLADLGTGGCGFEQPLEAVLKALWPKTDVNFETQQVVTPNRVNFLKDASGDGMFGHGDVENKGFSRSNVAEGASVLAIVVVTDEEDCSSLNTDHFKPQSQLEPTDPNYNVDLNLRCFKNASNLFSISDRYVKAFKALRQGQDQLVVYAAIVGVPPDLVDTSARKDVNFADQKSRDTYYDSLLADPRMQQTIDPTRMVGDGNVNASCITEQGRAYPPRRLVTLAKEFGENAIVQSICQADFGPAMDVIVDKIGKRLGPACLPRPLIRESNGSVDCDIVWQLPPAGTAPTSTPVQCGGSHAFLKNAGKDDSTLTGENGGVICRVDQLKYAGGDQLESGEGWYYDDFSSEVRHDCSETPFRIAFSPEAKPPIGVTVKLICPAGSCAH